MMDMQTYFETVVKAQRSDTLANSDQITLGEAILMMEKIVSMRNGDYKKVVLDFCNFVPAGLHSWRGSYNELAIDYDDDYGKAPNEKEFLDTLKEAVNKEYTGYKGGQFVMSRQTPLWVDHSWRAGNTAVVNIAHDECHTVIITGYREY